MQNVPIPQQNNIIFQILIKLTSERLRAFIN